MGTECRPQRAVSRSWRQKIKSDKEALESAQKLIKDAADTIRSLKTKSKPQPQKKPDKNKEGNTKDVIIVGM